MKIRLNYWQLILLFLPTIAAFTTFNFLHTTQVSFRVVDFLFVLNICLATCYQAYLAIGFNKQNANQSTWFSIHMYIPVIFTITYLLYSAYFTFIKPSYANFKVEPIKRISHNSTTSIILFFLFYTAITFFIINNRYVSAQIKKVVDVDEQENLRLTFLNPMKQLVKVSWIVIIGGFALSVIIDIVRQAI
ncbi:hypothetical protein [Mucilaginibacter flavus]|uniref:hypothetical protein n=1 Tax=Mucilaginibacter flavus TaxID=931504 RepID=UPI0025B443EE|nr:hypothetical protein [Mucilaginibacter flavus]MDN3580511.1 hypothetical protein [Mucilaginibacter flavus]